MAGDRGLDLDRRHGAGARPDEVADRTEDRQEVLTVDLADLAGVVPAVDDGGGRRLRVGEVAVEQQRAAHAKLTCALDGELAEGGRSSTAPRFAIEVVAFEAGEVARLHTAVDDAQLSPRAQRRRSRRGAGGARLRTRG